MLHKVGVKPQRAAGSAVAHRLPERRQSLHEDFSKAFTKATCKTHLKLRRKTKGEKIVSKRAESG
jgi:hypothetical protein